MTSPPTNLRPLLATREGGGGGVLPEKKMGGGVRQASWNPYPISDQNLWFSLPYFRPDQKFDTLFQTWGPFLESPDN